MEKNRCLQVSGNCMATLASPSATPSPCVTTVPCTAHTAGAVPEAGETAAAVTVTLTTRKAFRASGVQAGAATADDIAADANVAANAVPAIFMVLVSPFMSGDACKALLSPKVAPV
jgi:hypothetical protein